MVLLLPRRTGWCTTAELEQVFGGLFGSDGDPLAQRWALDRVGHRTDSPPKADSIKLSAEHTYA